jgi:hypothetical protein
MNLLSAKMLLVTGGDALRAPSSTSCPSMRTAAGPPGSLIGWDPNVIGGLG